MVSTSNDDFNKVELKIGDESVSGNTYNVGDILIIPTPSVFNDEIFVDVAYKVLTVEDYGSYLLLTTETPSLEETFSDLEINGEYSSVSNIEVLGEVQIANAFANLNSVKSISYAVAAYNNAQTQPKFAAAAAASSPSVDIKIGTKTLPDINVKISKLNFSPFEVECSVTVKWKLAQTPGKDAALKPDGTGALTLVVSGSFSLAVSTYNYVSKENGTSRQGTITTQTWSISASIECQIKPNINNISLFKDKYIKDAELNKNKDLKKYYDGINEGDYSPLQAAYYMRESRDAYTIAMAERKEHIKEQLASLAALYEVSQQGCSFPNDLVPVAYLGGPVGPTGLFVYIQAGFVVSFDLRAAFEIKYTNRTVHEEAQITTEHGTTTYKNSNSTSSFAAKLSGQLNIRFGVGITVDISFMKIAYAKFDFRAGLYIDLQGSLGVYFGDKSLDTLFDKKAAELFDESWFAGYGKFEIGTYHSAQIKAGFKITFIITIDISVTIPIAESKKPILSFTSASGDGLVYTDLVTENEKIYQSYDDIFNRAGMTITENERYFEKTLSFGTDTEKPLPQIFKRTINLAKPEIKYTDADFSDLIFEDKGDFIIDRTDGFENGRVTYIGENPYIDELVKITLKEYQGKYDFALWLRITKEHIPVENVSLSIFGEATSEIYVDQTKYIYAAISPMNATFKEVEFEILGIETPGGMISGAGYAAISPDGAFGKLQTFGGIQIGWKILIKATCIDLLNDAVKTDTLEVIVVRRPVTEIKIEPANTLTVAAPGSEYFFSVTANPANATYNSETRNEQVTIDNENYGTLISLGSGEYKLVIDINAPLMQNLTISATINDNGRTVTGRLEILISSIPLESLALINESENEFDLETQVRQGDKIKFDVVLNPEDAAVDSVYVSTSAPRSVAIIDMDNFLIIINDTAEIGTEFTVSVSYRTISTTYTFVVEKTAVSQIILKTPNDTDEAEVEAGQMIRLLTTIDPEYATNREIDYIITEGAQYATISYGYLVLMKDCPKDTVIKVKAVIYNIDGDEESGIEAESGIITITALTPTVIRIPVTYVEFDNSGFDVNPRFTYNISARTDSDATYNGITFSLEKDAIVTANANAELLGGSYDQATGYYTISLKVLPGAAVGEQITVYAIANDKNEIKECVKFTITAIYATRITGADITGASIGGNTVMCDDVLTVHELFFDVTNNTYTNFTLSLNNYDFTYIIDNKVFIKSYEEIKHIINESNHTFDITFTVNQPGGSALYYSRTIDIFIPLSDLSIVYDSALVTNGQDITVSRADASGHYNTLTFDVLIGLYYTPQPENEYGYWVNVTSIGINNFATAPTISYAPGSVIGDSIFSIKFNEYYTHGVKFNIEITTGDFDFAFTIIIAQIEMPKLMFGYDSMDANIANDDPFNTDGDSSRKLPDMIINGEMYGIKQGRFAKVAFENFIYSSETNSYLFAGVSMKVAINNLDVVFANGIIEVKSSATLMTWIEIKTTLTDCNSTQTSTFTIVVYSNTDDIAISNESELQTFKKNVGNYKGIYVYLTTNIDLGGVEWVPIGITQPFSGIFDGRGFVISSFKITSTNSGYAGLFGKGENCIIKNLGVENFCIDLSYSTMNSAAGGLIAHADSAVVINCYAMGDVICPAYNYAHVGGLVGRVTTVVIMTNCFATGDVVASSLNYCAYGGVLIGNTDYYCSAVTLTNCYAIGNVTSLASNDSSSAGGLIGCSSCLPFNSVVVTLTNCYATGDVISSALKNRTYAGGLIGDARSNIRGIILSNCYATGNVNFSAFDGFAYVGSLIGYASFPVATLINCYATGDVVATVANGNAYVGGLIGYNISSIVALNNCYATGNISVDASGTTYIGALIGFGNKKITNSFRYIGQQFLINGEPATPSDDDLFTCTLDDLNNISFYTNVLNWDSLIWVFNNLDFTNGFYPKLRFEISRI